MKYYNKYNYFYIFKIIIYKKQEIYENLFIFKLIFIIENYFYKDIV